MKMFLSAIILICLFHLNVCGKIWRVNKDPAADADFTEIQATHNAAQNGDTILVEGSNEYYAQVTCNKQLHFYATGYFLDENPETQMHTESAKVLGFIFDPGSSGSILCGFLNVLTNSSEHNPISTWVPTSKALRINTRWPLWNSSNVPPTTTVLTLFFTAPYHPSRRAP